MKVINIVDNFDNLKTATLYGADYISYDITKLLYTRNIDFIIEELSNASDYVYSKEKHLFLSTDIIAKNEDIQVFPEYLKILKQVKIEGLILADPVIFMYIKKELPRLNLILSNKTNIKSWLAVRMWEDYSAYMCTLNEQLNLEEIKEIRNKCKNSNLCTIIHNIKHFNDISSIMILPELINMNMNYIAINSINQDQYYVGKITQIYKKAIDDITKNLNNYNSQKYIDELLEITKNKLILNYTSKVLAPKNNFDIQGCVESWGNDYINIKINKRIKEGAEIEFLSPINNQKYKAVLDEITHTLNSQLNKKGKNISIKVPLEWFKKDNASKDKIMINLPPSTIIKQIS